MPDPFPPHRIPLANGDEYTALTKWRRLMKWTTRAGACRAVKRGYARRLRHVAKRVLKGARDEEAV